jgi:hypothetical protein
MPAINDGAAVLAKLEMTLRSSGWRRTRPVDTGSQPKSGRGERHPELPRMLLDPAKVTAVQTSSLQ